MARGALIFLGILLSGGTRIERLGGRLEEEKVDGINRGA